MPQSMIDPLGRRIRYLRLSVTDRCDLRCRYCMGQDTEFAPKSEVLSLEELERLCGAFIRLGVRKLRVTGGEPLVRPGVMGLISRLGEHVSSGALDELTLTTNGTQLATHAAALHAAGIRRINVSLDSLDAANFRSITRHGHLGKVLDGIATAQAAGLKIKINTLVLRGLNDHELDTLIAWCGAEDHDLTLIELMPVGALAGLHNTHYFPFDELMPRLSRWTLTPVASHTGGPARTYTVAETGGRLGFISPLTHGFCQDCNRVRLTCTGRLYPCLGKESYADLAPALRGSEGDARVEQAIEAAIDRKTGGHLFAATPQAGAARLLRRMNATGG